MKGYLIIYLKQNSFRKSKQLFELGFSKINQKLKYLRYKGCIAVNFLTGLLFAEVFFGVIASKKLIRFV